MTKTSKPSLGELLFRWRSYLPVVVVGGLLWGLYHWGPSAVGSLRRWVLAGLLLAALGLSLRLYAVGHAPRGTSGRHRKQHAAQLNTFGIYSIMRHPLYVGNVMVWVGVSLTSGWLPGAVASAVAGVFMFALIVRHEDDFLRRRFEGEFEEWGSVTPAFVPRFTLWRPARRPFRWATAIASEYSTLHSIGLMALLFAALRDWRTAGVSLPGRAWWCLFVLNSGIYLCLRLWRARRKRTIQQHPAPAQGS